MEEVVTIKSWWKRHGSHSFSGLFVGTEHTLALRTPRHFLRSIMEADFQCILDEGCDDSSWIYKTSD